MLYFDTSALLPYYRLERHSEAVEDLLRRQEEAVLIRQLTRVEFTSALARWTRMRQISEVEANRIEAAFEQDLQASRFQIRPLTAVHYERATAWLLARRTSLRASTHCTSPLREA
ncbi:MAG: type II toxin-antitoxin system VapC family toxin [Trueperaceae bacterium]|nr:type II toxin-antitoxin system VapC family toxin [Trueperaceae bacterium]